MRAYRVKAVITEDHHIAATLPDDAPEVDDPEDLAAYRRALKEYEETGRKSVPFENVCREMGL